MGEFNQAKYIQEYQKEKYDRCIFNVPKGHKDLIENHFKTKGYKSLNTYVNALIKADMENIEEQTNQKKNAIDKNQIDQLQKKICKEIQTLEQLKLRAQENLDLLRELC